MKLAVPLGVATTTLIFLLAHKPSRRRLQKFARVLWNGDEAFAEQHAKLLEVAATAAAWRPDGQLATLNTELAALEIATMAGERGLTARRAALQKRLGEAHVELWKAQDALDTMTADVSASSLDEEDITELRARRKMLVKELAKALDLKDGLEARFNVMAVQAAGGGKAAAAASTSSEAQRGSRSNTGASSGSNGVQATTTNSASSGNEMRGYKLNAEGRKTSYFNHDLDDEAKALIGDITPQKIDTSGSAADAASGGNAAAGGAASAWNAAGTWEERNVSDWGRARLAALVSEATAADVDQHRVAENTSTSSASNAVGFTSYEVVSKRVHGVTGDCAVTTARGKVKHLFDLSFTVEWVLKEMASSGRSGSSGNGEVVCTGRLKYADVTPAELGDAKRRHETEGPCNLEPCLELDGAKHGQSQEVAEALNRVVRPFSCGLQAAVVQQMHLFAAEFNQL